jgi:D-alanyl-lipoteichoic acid acyltransferase DltB (MBOAT superfamily)
MLFNSAVYALFLAVAYAGFWSLRAHKGARSLFLLAASYFFYFFGTYDTATHQQVPLGAVGWSFLCLGIIFIGSSLDFAIGRVLAKTEDPRKRKALLLVSVVYYLGVLAIFKYYDFFVDSFVGVAALGGVAVKAHHLRLVLPFGISFFTFETMSYTIDVYRKEIEPAKNYLDYLLFVAFFPHLVAGPIVRPHWMLPQLQADPNLDAGLRADGMFLIVKGLTKKVLVGDYLKQNLVDRVFDNPERYTSFETLVAVVAYALQIYADFSGYTDVALGSAQLFGYRLNPNFNRPYLAENLQEFWHRWHISLSSWLRDYLYIPLGGSRGSSWATYRNLMITMLLGGLWHGANWNYVIWGFLHGLALGGTRAFQRKFPPKTGDAAATPAARGMRVLTTGLTFAYVCFAWIFFRAGEYKDAPFQHAWLVLTRVVAFVPGTEHLTLRIFGIVALGLGMHFFPLRFVERLKIAFRESPAVVQGIALAAAAYALHFAGTAKSEPFIYGQF